MLRWRYSGLRRHLAGTGLAEQELKSLFDAIDADGSSCIDLEEFADFVQDSPTLFSKFDSMVKRESKRRDEDNHFRKMICS